MLFDLVCEHLNLLEKDYFGLTFCDADSQKVPGWEPAVVGGQGGFYRPDCMYPLASPRLSVGISCFYISSPNLSQVSGPAPCPSLS